MKPARTAWEYRGCIITRLSRTSLAGMKYEAYTSGQFVYADTLAGMKALIREVQGVG